MLPAEGPPQWAQDLWTAVPRRSALMGLAPTLHPWPWIQLLLVLLNRTGFCLCRRRVRALVRDRAHPACPGWGQSTGKVHIFKNFISQILKFP